MLMMMNEFQSNIMFDPFVEAGYLGCSIRATAHRQRERTIRPSLKIRDCRRGSKEILYEFVFQEPFLDADAAIERAMGKGRQVIDDSVEMANLEEPVYIEQS